MANERRVISGYQWACRQAGPLGGAPSAAALAKQREQEADADEARKRFGNAKSISSAQFNSNEDSNAMDYEKQVCILHKAPRLHSHHRSQMADPFGVSICHVSMPVSRGIRLLPPVSVQGLLPRRAFRCKRH